MPKTNLTEISPLERMIQQQIVDRGIRDDRVISAIRAVPREKFFRARAERKRMPTGLRRLVMGRRSASRTWWR